MKQLSVLLVAFVTLNASAQEPPKIKRHKGTRGDMSVAQLAILHTKKLTLALDLTEDQQKEIVKISMEEVRSKKAKRAEMEAKKDGREWKRPTTDEQFEMENAFLNRQIAHHQQMKEILTDDQYQLWKKLKLQKAMNGQKRMQEKDRRG